MNYHRNFCPNENLYQERPAENVNMQKCPSLSEFFNLNQVLLSVSQHVLSGINPSAHTAAVSGITVGSRSHHGLNEALTSKKCLLVNPGCWELHPHVN